MTTMTPEKLEQELLEIHFLEDGLKCGDWSKIGCQNEASHFVVCPCKEGRCSTCERCLALLREKVNSRILGIFRRPLWFYATCGHSAHFEACTIQPI